MVRSEYEEVIDASLNDFAANIASAVSGRQITVEEMDWKTFTVYLPYDNGL